jgi:tetrahydromethanopterin S-methyltransferase subunit F
VIPDEGRDVQCSNCGDTWYQEHPDHPAARAPDVPEDDDAPDGEYPDDTEGRDDDRREDHRERIVPETPHSGLDASVRDMLREEADREEELRAIEAAGGLESQPELGLDGGGGDDAARREAEARGHMARIRGEDPARPAPRQDPAASDSRRGLLPNIDEINATLKSDDDVSLRNALSTHIGESGSGVEARQRSGFARGFAISLIVVMVLVLVYAKAPKISQAVPQVDPALNVYVSLVDQARLWLDTRIGDLVPR